MPQESGYVVQKPVSWTFRRSPKTGFLDLPTIRSWKWKLGVSFVKKPIKPYRLTRGDKPVPD